MTAGDSRRWWALGALALSVLVVALDLFVLTLALPTVSADLHASSGDLQWFVDAYSLVLAAALLPAGLLGDRVGRKPFLIGYGISQVAAALVAVATSAPPWLAGAAMVGGFGRGANRGGGRRRGGGEARGGGWPGGARAGGASAATAQRGGHRVDRRRRVARARVRRSGRVGCAGDRRRSIPRDRRWHDDDVDESAGRPRPGSDVRRAAHPC